jgi:hypothetical protein
VGDPFRSAKWGRVFSKNPLYVLLRRLDVADRVADRLDALGVLLGDLDLELLLEREHELDDGERVRLEVVDERGLGLELVDR